MTDPWIKRAPILHKIEEKIPYGRNKWAFRFRGRYTITKTGCFVYSGACDRDGYPSFSYKNKRIRGNQLSWVLIHGPIPEGMQVCHICDNPGCINPTHLFLGTTQENTKDRDLKCRQARGEKQAFCKLNPEIVLKMRGDYFQRGKSIRTIAAAYNICFATAREAIQGITWAWV